MELLKRERERETVYSIIDRTIWIRDFLFGGRKSIVNRGREGKRRSSWIQNINQVLGEGRARKIFGNYDKPLSIVGRPPPRQSPSSRLSFENGDFGRERLSYFSRRRLLKSNGNESKRKKRIKTRSEERNLEESGKINNNRIIEEGDDIHIYTYIGWGKKRELVSKEFRGWSRERWDIAGHNPLVAIFLPFHASSPVASPSRSENPRSNAQGGRGVL